MSPGGTNEASFGLIRNLQGSELSAICSISAKETGVGFVSFQTRRVSWKSQLPMIFDRKRILPSSPPSFVKLFFSESALRNGFSISAPSSAQVPALM